MEQTDPRHLLVKIARILSSKQLEDVESIFKISGDKLDRSYLIKWAQKLGVFDLLSPFLKSKE